MTDVKTEPLPPVPVTIIGTGDGGSPSLAGTIATTPGQQPNLLVVVVTPLAAITVRALNNFFTMLVALVGAAMTSNVIPASDFWHLVLKCATLSVAGAGLGALKDIVTIFSKLENKFPLLTGSV
jgi:hypothetical protein